MDTTKILIVDDDEADYLLTCTYLNDISDEKFETHWASNYPQGLAKIDKIKPDICLFDFLLGEKTGLNLIRELREMGNDVPIILLTSNEDPRIDRAAVEVGAADYLLKSTLNTTVLTRSIRYALANSMAFRAVRASAQRYRTIFEQSKNMIFLLDAANERFLEINPFGCALFGYDRATFLNDLTARNLFYRAEDAAILLNILRGQPTVSDYEVTLVTNSGQRLQCLISAVSQVNTQGEQEFHGTLSDITAIRQTEQGRLFTEKLAARGRFARTVAHEVRNPLTNIALSAEQLESEDLNEDALYYVGIIKRNTLRINNLITELLQFSSPEQMQFSTYMLNDLLENSLESALDKMTMKGVKIIKNLSPTLPSVKADADKLQMALFNILINAAEAMVENEGILTLTTADNTNDTCRVSIGDNGCGIADEQLNRLFEPYFTNKKAGIGMGLATTLNIVQAHGGQIQVLSEVGNGTQFNVILPK